MLRIADTVAVISIVFCYSFLLHVHIYLWANAAERALKRSEKIRIYLSYLPTVGLPFAIYKIWTHQYAPMLQRTRLFVLPMAVWISYVLAFIAITEILIARRTKNASEQRIMRTLAASFVGIGIVILAALALGLGEGTQLGLYLKTIANLGSLLPSALLAYYIYRYRYLELIIEESLIVASFAAVVLTIYLYGIRTIGDWMTLRYGVRAGVIEALLILALALAAVPLRVGCNSASRSCFHARLRSTGKSFRESALTVVSTSNYLTCWILSNNKLPLPWLYGSSHPVTDNTSMRKTAQTASRWRRQNHG